MSTTKVLAIIVTVFILLVALGIILIIGKLKKHLDERRVKENSNWVKFEKKQERALYKGRQDILDNIINGINDLEDNGHPIQLEITEIFRKLGIKFYTETVMVLSGHFGPEYEITSYDVHENEAMLRYRLKDVLNSNKNITLYLDNNTYLEGNIRYGFQPRYTLELNDTVIASGTLDVIYSLDVKEQTDKHRIEDYKKALDELLILKEVLRDLNKEYL